MDFNIIRDTQKLPTYYPFIYFIVLYWFKVDNKLTSGNIYQLTPTMVLNSQNYLNVHKSNGSHIYKMNLEIFEIVEESVF